VSFFYLRKQTLAMQILDLREEPQHIPILAAWHHHQWSSLNPDGSLEKRIAKMQDYLSDDFVPSTLIAKTDKLLGSAAIVENDMDTKPELTPWLASVFVAPQYRNQGIGSRLVKQLMQQAKQTGIEAIYLFTPDQVNFYQKLGWEVFSSEEYRGHSVTIMWVRLAEL
jgi:N-acetylglutamate synthase-like GNAT family acetyltransferase